GNWLLRPARTHEGDVLVGNWPSPLERLRVERLELFLEPAHARPEDDPAAREHIEGGEHLRRHHWIPVGNDQHAGAELDPRGLARETAHERQRPQLAACPMPRAP